MPRAVEGIALESLADVDAQGREIGVVTHRGREFVVELGQDLLAQLFELDFEVRRFAGQLGFGVIVRERHVELRALPRPEAGDVVLEARDQPLLAENERHPLG